MFGYSPYPQPFGDIGSARRGGGYESWRQRQAQQQSPYSPWNQFDQSIQMANDPGNMAAFGRSDLNYNPGFGGMFGNQFGGMFGNMFGGMFGGMQNTNPYFGGYNPMMNPFSSGLFGQQQYQQPYQPQQYGHQGPILPGQTGTAYQQAYQQPYQQPYQQSYQQPPTSLYGDRPNSYPGLNRPNTMRGGLQSAGLTPNRKPHPLHGSLW